MRYNNAEKMMMRRTLCVCGLILISIFTLFTSALADEPATLPDTRTLHNADNNKTITLTTEKHVSILLDGNPTTGFSWTLKSVDAESVEAVGNVEYQPTSHAPGVVGSGGQFVANFDVKKPGKSIITLEYARPWEKNTPPAHSYTVTIIVPEVAATSTAPAKQK